MWSLNWEAPILNYKVMYLNLAQAKASHFTVAKCLN